MLGDGQLVSDWLQADEIIPRIEPGDLLEFRRTALIGQTKRRIYTHWAVYIGHLEGIARVVHHSTPDGDFDGVSGERIVRDSFAGLSKIVKGTQMAEVRCDTLHDVAGDDLLRVNNSLDATNRPFPPNIVVERATHQMGAGDYNIIFNNCEHFCKQCRYGNKISSQAVAAKSVALSSILAVGVNPSLAIGAGLLFAITSESLSQYLHRKFSTNFRFF